MKNTYSAKSVLILTFVIALPALAVTVAELRSSAPDNARVYFIEPQSDAMLPATFAVKFGLTGMGVAPAGSDVDDTGHHHLLIDRPGDLDFNLPLPATDQVIHFGGGQTETKLTLSPGPHCLQLLMGNYLHIPHNPPIISEEICVTISQ